MAKKIEILENTLLKLLVRRGTDTDRRNITLAEGELGFTTDTERLFIGNGDVGGTVAGNKFLGCDSDPAVTFSTALTGDLAFDTNTKSLCAYKGTGTWERVSTITDDTGDIDVSVDAGDILTNACGRNMQINSAGRIQTKGNSLFNKIDTINTDFLSIPRKINFYDDTSSKGYTFPTNALGGKYLRTDAGGNLTWEDPVGAAEFFYNSENGPIPVGAVLPFTAAGVIPTGYIVCDGQEVTKAAYPDLYDVIGESYGTTNTGVTFKVPDYINSTLYGSNTNPVSDSTEYKVGADVFGGGAEFGTQWQQVSRGYGQFNETTGTLTSIPTTYTNDTGYYLVVNANGGKNTQDYVRVDVVLGTVNGGLSIYNQPGGYVNLFTSTNSGGGVACNGTVIIPPGEKYTFFQTTDSGMTRFDVEELRGPSSGGGDLGSTTQSPLSAQGTIYVIKAIPDQVANPTLTVVSPLTATVNGVDKTNTAVTPLSGDIVIGQPDAAEAVPPGVEVFDTAGDHTFTTVTRYTKFYVTGSGATGGRVTGGSAATVIGYLDLPIGTAVNVDVGAGVPQSTKNVDGDKSRIIVNGDVLAKSNGAICPIYEGKNPYTAPFFNDGTLLLSDSRVSSGYIVKGARGGTDTNGDGSEESEGPASFWGGCPAPGAGGMGHQDLTQQSTGDGMVMFEWT